MPEGDTIFRTAQALHKTLAGPIVTRFERRVPVATHVRLDPPVEGRRVDSVAARGKWILMGFRGDLILVTTVNPRPRETLDRWRSLGIDSGTSGTGSG